MNKYLRFPALKAVYMYILWALIGSLRYFVRFDWLMWYSVVKVIQARFKPSHILINEVQLWFFPTGVPFSMRRTPLADEKVHQTLLEVLTRVTHSRAHRVSFSFTEEEREKIRFVYRRASSFTLVGQGLSLSLSATSNIAVKSRHVKTWTNKAISCSAFILILLAYW